MENLFDYDIECASPYLYLQKHYGNDGILTMLPSKIKETEFQLSARFPALRALLDLRRPDFLGDLLRLYFGVVDRSSREIPSTRALWINWITGMQPHSRMNPSKRSTSM